MNFISFNFKRILFSKYFVFSTISILLLSLILWTIWLLVKIEIYMVWIVFATCIIWLTSIDIYTISNIMIDDVKNGVFGLEVRKGKKPNLLIWQKLLISKVIIWSTIAFAMLIFYCLTLIFKPLRIDMFLDGYIPGYTVFYTLDILLTGLCLLFGSGLSSKLMSFVISFFSAILVFSPLIGVLQTITIKELFIQEQTLNRVPLEIQKMARKNQNGLVSFLYKNLLTLNEKNNIEISLMEDADSQEIETYEQVKLKLNDNNLLERILIYYTSVGQPIDVDNYLNSNSNYNKYLKFSITDNYKNSDLFNFFNDTKIEQEEFKPNNIFISDKSMEQLKGKNQLFDYMDFLTTESMIKNLEDNYSIKNLKTEIKTLKDLFLDYWNYQRFGIKAESGSRVYNVGYFEKSFDFYDVSEFANYFFSSINDDYGLKDGNQLFIILMSNFIFQTSVLVPNTGENVKKDFAYNFVYNDWKKRRQIFLTNPVLSLPYMYLFTKISKKPEVNNALMETLMPGPAIQDLAMFENEDYIERDKWSFKDKDELPIQSFENTKLAFNPIYYYMSYLILGFSFIFIGYLIYIRKLRP
ncbi:hypothetical protein SCHIN_v1c11660 [Spiroplasma chinense]|uniref:Uncharacterized protein n=1 Tax=Spiroplasma chinense TaxID=216932 RepID=A0A5B9Y6N4_9MOLU|nr:hypothetical protein [Spiroplasma chinense]QEH62359.1 hypothetical protein SCHIN_v1c11660 [Spiroplasma chinense]